MALYTRTNLVTNPRFGAGTTTGWTTKTGFTAAADSSLAYEGSYSGLFTNSTGGSAALSVGFGADVSGATAAKTAYSMPVTAGTTYTFTAFARASAAVTVYMRIYWFNSAGTYLSRSTGSPNPSLSATAWTPARVTAAAPTGAAYAAAVMDSTANVANGLAIRVGLVAFSADSGAPFSGSTASTSDYSYAWTGAADASTSTEAKLRRVNFATNPSFEAGSGGWAYVGGTIAQSSSFAHSRTYSLQLTSTGTGPYISASPSIAINQLDVMTVAFWVYSPGKSITATVALMNTGQAAGSAISVPADTWTRVSVVAREGSEALTAITPRIAFSGVVSGDVIYIDDTQIERSYTLDDYFDGSTTLSGFTTAWTGTADDSTSTATPASGSTREAALSVTTAAGPTHLGVQAKLGVAATAGPTRTSRNAPLAVSASVAANTGFQRTAALGVSVSTTPTRTSRNAPLNVAAGASASWASAKSRTAPLGVSVTPSTQWTPKPKRTAPLAVEAVLSAEAFWEPSPLPLEDQPLGKLSDFRVETSAVPVNPTEGSGGVPSVTGTFIAGKAPRSVLGQQVTVRHDAIGSWKGKAVQVKTNGDSERVPVTIETPLTRLSTDLRVFPIMPAAPTVQTAMQAIDYWTQQAGMPYDAIDGDVLWYQSSYGHPFAYARGFAKVKFYEKGTATVSALGDRQVRSFDGSGIVKAWDSPDTRVPVGVQGNDLLVLQTGASGSGAVRFVFEDGKRTEHTVLLTCTGTDVSATVDGVAGPTVTASGTVRAALSLRPASPTAWVARLTAGSGDSGPVVLFPSLPQNLYLKEVRYEGSGGTRFGTGVSLAKAHPRVAAQPQKSLTPTAEALPFVSGFEGNVWDRLIEFCSLHRIDLTWEDDVLTARPRQTAFVAPEHFEAWDVTDSIRERYREVKVMDKRSKAVTDAVLYRADSVYQVARGEVFETTVSTDHSVLSVNNPVCVDGIDPFPYKSGTGQYVVTGADGYIVPPAYWSDYGGKAEAFLTEKEGEIRIRITAPSIETVRAPYRISEGAADRPALYITGAGIFNEPEEVTVDTGDTSAREGSANTFESPFLTGRDQVYETVTQIAVSQMQGTEAEFTLPVEELGQHPAGKLFADGDTVWRVVTATQNKSHVSGTAVPHMTIANYTASFPSGSTLAAHTARSNGRTLGQTDLTPLKEH